VTDNNKGIFTLGQGLVTSYGGLVAMRFLIGVCEAGLIPGKNSADASDLQHP
jgi:hypothetical protein